MPLLDRPAFERVAMGGRLIELVTDTAVNVQLVQIKSG